MPNSVRRQIIFRLCQICSQLTNAFHKVCDVFVVE
jgi:hypothetical protein